MKNALSRRQPRSIVRRLVLESLEQRRLLFAGAADEISAEPAADVVAPWHNYVYPLDVNNSGTTTTSDILAVVNRILDGHGGDLPEPTGQVTTFYDTTGDNRLTTSDILAIVNGMLKAPVVETSSLTPFTSDTTPLVTVTAQAPNGSPLPDGSVVILDVDLNNDGNFDGEGETGRTQSTLFSGTSTFEITPALERTDAAYSVAIRARVIDAGGVVGRSDNLPLIVDTVTSTALEDYVNAPDDSYTYSVDSIDESNQDYTYYVLNMTSQTWRSTADVDDPVWDHWIGVYVPNSPISGTALMAIGGGSNTSGPPSNSPNTLGAFAVQSKTVVFELTTIPNEPVTFTDENFSRSEDEIIAYTFDKYMQHLGEPGNETWPLLLPMVKSAVRAMDTIQDFIPGVRPDATIDEFVVFGGSKRGWTTWLTAAVDDRVAAIMPGVIDVLNIPPQMVHHYAAYGFFSAAIEDYENLHVFDRLLTPEGQELFRIVDPYRYLENGRFDNMRKLIVNSSGDEFFVSDAAQFYINDLPGNLNRLRYVPNTGHGLEDTAIFNSVISFYGAYLLDAPLPEYSWTVEQDGSIHVQTTAFQPPSEVRLWQATNPISRDFRHLLTGDIWTSSLLVDQGGGVYVGDVPMPASGATAYFVELTFPFPSPGVPPYVFTTEVRVKTNLPLYPWPFNTPDVTVTSLTPHTIDTTPWVTVTAKDTVGIADGAAVFLDVDLNGDGDFDDKGEIGYTQSTIYQGSSYFQITPALPRTTQVYTVNLRARVTNTLGYEGTSELLPLEVDTLTSTALADYVNAPDDSYTYSLFSTDTTTSSEYTYYVLKMTSQTWRSTADVDDPVWDHYIGVYVPNGAIGDTALMVINGGSNTAGPPGNSKNDLGLLATLTGTVVYNLRTVPNESVTFTDENFSRTEDEIIAYTFNKYLEHIGEPGNETWPLLLPMVKSAVRAMDTIQDFIPTVKPGAQINEFVVNGYSKRGWTTWLTAAVDDRVTGILPGVIDVLNMGPQMVHHYGVYSFFSEEIHDYQDLHIFDRMLTDEGRELGRIVDPYSYLYNGRFDDMRKLLLVSAGDEFFVSDSAQFYYDDIPGEQTRLRYFPNTGHGLDPSAVTSIASFYGALLNDQPMPEYSWTVEQDGSIHAQTSSNPTKVLLWQATNPTERDFRHGYRPSVKWTSTPLVDQGGGNYVGDVPVPATGATAYFIEMTFESAIPGYPFVFTTEIRVKSTLPIADWPFDTGSLVEPIQATPVANVDTGLDAVATALVLTSQFDFPQVDDALPLLALEMPVPLPPATANRVQSTFWEDDPRDSLVSQEVDELELIVADDMLADLLA